jgi:hypothetical protein
LARYAAPRTLLTGVPADDLIFVVSGNRPIQPIFAVKPGASRDISLDEGQTSNEHIAWGKMRGGPYMPSPIVYGPRLYVCSNAGVVTCYEGACRRIVYMRSDKKATKKSPGSA